jgi:general stress protein 26
MTQPETARDDSTGQDRRKVAELVRGVRIAMLTTVEPGGDLVSHPMATQDVELDSDIWFITERGSDTARNIEASPRVNVAYSGDSSWVSVSGSAEVVDDEARLAELWNTFTDAWMEGGPDNPENVLVHVRGESAQYWDSPGAKVTQLVNLVKAKVTGERYEPDGGTVGL